MRVDGMESWVCNSSRTFSFLSKTKIHSSFSKSWIEVIIGCVCCRCLGLFLLLVHQRGLTWDYSSEVRILPISLWASRQFRILTLTFHISPFHLFTFKSLTFYLFSHLQFGVGGGKDQKATTPSKGMIWMALFPIRVIYSKRLRPIFMLVIEATTVKSWRKKSVIVQKPHHSYILSPSKVAPNAYVIVNLVLSIFKRVLNVFIPRQYCQYSQSPQHFQHCR